MRILYSHRVHSRDGQGVHIEELVSALRRAGAEILVVGPGAYKRAEFGGESALLAAIRRALPAAFGELAELYYNIPAALSLHRAAKSFNPEVIYERYNLYYLAGILLKRWRRIPLYLEINAPLAEERARFSRLKLRRLARALETAVWRSADRIFVVTEALKAIVAAAGVQPDRIAVVPNGVDHEAYPLVPYMALAAGPVRIGFIGFVRDWHGLDAVIDGLARPHDPPIRLIVAGDGPARPALEQQARQSGVSELVEFVGVKQRESIPDLVRSFDIALQPRAVAYASPLKLFEYMAGGRAIVAPDQANIREILGDGETAILFDPQDPAALWRAILRLAGDPLLRERLGRAARLALDTHGYTWQANAARITAAIAADLATCSGSASVDFAANRPSPRGLQ
ncbi:MAG TPA: glycosyltransferase family 4 protein [Stellaceae bacterium]